MKFRPLEENEELLGDQIASLFYVTTPVSIQQQIKQLTPGWPQETIELVTDVTILRLKNEQAARRQYLLTQLGLTEDGDTEATLLNSASSTDNGVLTQLGYYRTVTSNLLRYELENWQAENQEILKALLRQSKPAIIALGDQLQSFCSQFYSGGYFQNLALVSIPPALQEQLTKMGLGNELNNRPTIVQQAAYISYLSQVCTIITALPEGITEPDALFVISTSTFSFRSVIEITPTA